MLRMEHRSVRAFSFSHSSPPSAPPRMYCAASFAPQDGLHALPYANHARILSQSPSTAIEISDGLPGKPSCGPVRPTPFGAPFAPSLVTSASASLPPEASKRAKQHLALIETDLGSKRVLHKGQPLGARLTPQRGLPRAAPSWGPHPAGLAGLACLLACCQPPALSALWPHTRCFFSPSLPEKAQREISRHRSLYALVFQQRALVAANSK
ncbi:hypothetical protein BS50DRAFT_85151 [Corynespora cassiicola Philippines]|uniref:Uncharacterized protein n=1 Tax=Corynespora cassiicola Philippines TaxID=1448308 RepID=A0A2T2NE18_CORCC|nr:hypothetical protein BS50DRAFT_85151 [Corynespora cassiicola Philippines]